MVFYFAFGSNLSIEQMHRRCPSSQVASLAVLEGFQIAFAGRSCLWDGGGVATIRKNPVARVPGLLYRLSLADLARLDRCEGHPHHYVRQRVLVRGDGGQQILAWTYALNRADNAPSDDYLAVIAEAYHALGFVDDDVAHASLMAAADVPRVVDRPTVSAWAMSGRWSPDVFEARVRAALEMAGRHDDASAFSIERLILDRPDSFRHLTEVARRYVDVIA